MSGDASIGPVGQVTQAGPAPSVPAGSAAPQAATAAPGGGLYPPNPSVHLDLALNLVVLEFHDGSGNVTSSIPSTRQLQAYRLEGVPSAIRSPDTAPATPAPDPADRTPGLSRLG